MFGKLFARHATYRELQHVINHTDQVHHVLWGAIHILQKENQDMANDLTALQASVEALEDKVAAMPPPPVDQQPAIDDLTTRVDAVTAVIPSA